MKSEPFRHYHQKLRFFIKSFAKAKRWYWALKAQLLRSFLVKKEKRSFAKKAVLKASQKLSGGIGHLKRSFCAAFPPKTQ